MRVSRLLILGLALAVLPGCFQRNVVGIEIVDDDQIPTVDLKINGSDRRVFLDNAESFNLSWESDNAEKCEMTSPVKSGIELSGSITVQVTHSWYPGVGQTVVFSISCGDKNDTVRASDNVGVTRSG